MNQDFEYIFPSIKGMQAGREFYISMCPLGLIPKIFLFDEEELRPDLRAQRYLNRNRIPEIARYILDNETNYVFSALTASIDSKVRFDPTYELSNTGSLHIPMTAKFIINDGQHRRAAIEMALNEKPELSKETIAVVFFLDPDLDRCQQMFADLNRYAIRSGKSLNVLYDKRDRLSQITKEVVFGLPFFKTLVEFERSNLSLRSRKLFTLSSIYSAHKALLKDKIQDDTKVLVKIAQDFWIEVSRVIPDWERVRNNEIFASQIREDFVHTHGIILQAFGIVGAELLKTGKEITGSLEPLRKIDWSRSNVEVWEGRAMVGGRLSKSYNHIQVTAAYLKKVVGLRVSKNELDLEKRLLGDIYSSKEK